MQRDTIRVVARFPVQRERVDEFAKLARSTLVEPTQREAGCLEYDIWQDTSDPTRFAMLEEWESAESLEAHLAQPSLQAAVAKLAPMADRPIEVQRLRRVRA